ncbi:antirepressor [Pseudomonas monteilii SB3101]|uniref:Antirepressor n=1 Tax=Pseudomonas monteilii SB3101 TaxID=1435058 RepID=V9V2H9_9PSED|nr:Bro-N domain-containing protein [Pseudomonas monteilii]AHC82674.1 antirepressor [Pseudomonas monteilii SB3078]AHC88050.1 antirepressor [Pseudomonas monteilii SB3101]
MTHPIHRTFENHNIRLLLINGEPWFVANDVSAALLYSEASAMTRHLDDDEKGLSNVQTPGGEQEMLAINESGLFSAILRSRKPEAKRFKKWVTGEVLPSLRKHGSYSITDTAEVQQPVPMAEHIEADRIVSAGRVFNTMFRTGRVIGMNRRMAASRANQATQRCTGVDLIAEMGASDWIDSADTPTPNRRQYQLQQQLRSHLAENDWPLVVTGPGLIEALGLTEDRANQMAIGQCLPLLGYRRVRLPANKGIRPWGYALQQTAVIEELSA